jgi:hypothetical protein
MMLKQTLGDLYCDCDHECDGDCDRDYDCDRDRSVYLLSRRNLMSNTDTVKVTVRVTITVTECLSYQHPKP